MSRTTRAVLNESNPNKVPSALQLLPGGEAVALIPARRTLVAVAGVTSLPSNEKAAAVLAAFSTGASPGWKTPVAPGATPGAGEVGISPDGDILFGDAAVVAAEVVYVMAEGTPTTLTAFSVVSGTLTLPSGITANMLLSATVVTGVLPGAVPVVDRGSTPGSGEVALSADGLTVEFHADEVIDGTATIEFLANPTLTVSEALAATNSNL